MSPALDLQSNRRSPAFKTCAACAPEASQEERCCPWISVSGEVSVDLYMFSHKFMPTLSRHPRRSAKSRRLRGSSTPPRMRRPEAPHIQCRRTRCITCAIFDIKVHIPHFVQRAASLEALFCSDDTDRGGRSGTAYTGVPRPPPCIVPFMSCISYIGSSPRHCAFRLVRASPIIYTRNVDVVASLSSSVRGTVAHTTTYPSVQPTSRRRGETLSYKRRVGVWCVHMKSNRGGRRYRVR